MNSSIQCRLFFSDEKVAKETIKHLKKIGLDCDKYRKKDVDYMDLDDIFIIEFKETPFIFEILEYNNFTNNTGSIYISSISEYGISFYIAGPDMGDGNILVPMSNINCIHTIEKEQIDEYTKWKNRK